MFALSNEISPVFTSDVKISSGFAYSIVPVSGVLFMKVLFVLIPFIMCALFPIFISFELRFMSPLAIRLPSIVITPLP